VIVEVDHAEARMELPFHPRLDCHWAIRRPQQKPGASLLKTIREVEIAAGATIWAAGEAGAMSDVRKYFLEERGFDRRRVTVRGYWKLGR
jgi:NADPH-dependent ferric siderophore reductase